MYVCLQDSGNELNLLSYPHRVRLVVVASYIYLYIVRVIIPVLTLREWPGGVALGRFDAPPVHRPRARARDTCQPAAFTGVHESSFAEGSAVVRLSSVCLSICLSGCLSFCQPASE